MNDIQQHKDTAQAAAQLASDAAKVSKTAAQVAVSEQIKAERESADEKIADGKESFKEKFEHLKDKAKHYTAEGSRCFGQCSQLHRRQSPQRFRQPQVIPQLNFPYASYAGHQLNRHRKTVVITLFCGVFCIRAPISSYYVTDVHQPIH